MKSFSQFANLKKIDERVTFVFNVSANSPEMQRFIETYRLGSVGQKVEGGDRHVDGGTILDVDTDIIVVALKNGAYFYITEVSIKDKQMTVIVLDDPKSQRILKGLL